MKTRKTLFILSAVCIVAYTIFQIVVWQILVRIDKKLDTEYYPLWTVEEGFVKEGESFIKLRGKYYSATFLEKLLDSVDRLKSQINLPYL